MAEIQVDEFRGWLQKLNFQSVPFYTSHLTTGLKILDFFHNPSNNPKTTIKINQSTDQIKA